MITSLFGPDLAPSGSSSQAPLTPLAAGASLAAATVVDPLLGTTLAGAYRIVEVIGSGGMGKVYRAEQTALDRSVAIKMLHPHLGADPSLAERFYNEARAASRLNHPNSVAVIDFGLADGQRPYLVMEYLRGRDLGTVLDTEGPLLGRPRICHIVLGILAALAEAHELGIVHRDLKPENVLLVRYRDQTEGVKVVDFGLAQLRADITERRPTEPGIVVGTPEYMSPEQFDGDGIDGRADLYALGVVLFELLTGRLPFVHDSILGLAVKHIHDPPPDPRSVAPPGHVPPLLAKITLRALAKRPADRFQTAGEMAAALEEAHHVLRARASWQDARPVRPSSSPAPGGGLSEQLARLDLPILQLVQATAVLGEWATLESVGAVTGGPDPALLGRLVSTGLIDQLGKDRIEMEPAVRDLVEASIPVAARRDLHDRALAWHGVHGSPLSVRADHAYRGSEPLVALVLLEQLGDECLARAAFAGAIHAFQRGLSVARLELGRTGEEVFEYGVLAFSRKLAEGLRRQGRRAEAEGVLRESLDVTAPESKDRARVLALLQALRDQGR